MRILVIEDNEQFSLLLCAALRDVGFEVDNAMSGKAGIKTAMSYRPDLILLDYHLGDMSGYDVAIGIRCMRITANIPFLLLSSMAGDQLVAGGFKKMPNCLGALSKTLSLNEVVAAVKRAAAGS